MTSPAYDQDTFRGRDDNYGLNVDSGWYGAVNGDDWTQDVDTTFRVRFVIRETNNKAVNNIAFALYYEKNGDGNPAGATPVTTSSNDVILVNDGQGIADNATTSQVIGGGTYTSGDSEGWDDGQTDVGTGNVDFGGNDEAEVEFCLQIVGADVANGDQIQLYVLQSGGTQLNSYSDWPDVTVSKAATAAVGQAQETDLAQAIAAIKSDQLGQATETDAALSVNARKSVAVGQAQETDAAQAMAWAPKRRLVAQATETEIARPISVSGPIVESVSQASETDAAEAISWAPKHRLVEQASEAETAQGVTVRKRVVVAQAVESDAGQGISIIRTLILAQATETDLAQGTSRSKTLTIGVALETELAQAITISADKFTAVNQATETDLAQAVKWGPKIRLVGQAAELNNARAINTLKAVPVSQATETEAAQAVDALKSVALGQVIEADTALAISWAPKIRQLGQVSETDVAQAIAWAPKIRIAGQATEADIAQAIMAVLIGVMIGAYGTVTRPSRSGVVTRPRLGGAATRPNRSGTVISDRQGD